MEKMFLKKDPSKSYTGNEWAEWEIQAYVVQELRRRGYFVEGDQNAAKRGYGAAAKAKACGMLAGTPDLRILLPKGIVLFVELKKLKGKMSESQNTWHNIARSLGHSVKTVYADCPRDAMSIINTALIDANI